MTLQTPQARVNTPLALDAIIPNKVRFSKIHNLRDRLSIILSGLSVVWWGILSTSSIPYAIANMTKWDWDGNATTLLTHMTWLEKTDESDGGAYRWDPNEALISTVTRDGKVIDSTFDKLMWFPGNFSILLGGLLLSWIGSTALTEKTTKDLKTRMREALEKWETLTFIKGSYSLDIKLYTNSSGLQQITITTKGKTTHISYNNANVEAIITRIIERHAQWHTLEDIVPNSWK